VCEFWYNFRYISVSIQWICVLPVPNVQALHKLHMAPKLAPNDGSCEEQCCSKQVTQLFSIPAEAQHQLLPIILLKKCQPSNLRFGAGFAARETAGVPQVCCPGYTRNESAVTACASRWSRLFYKNLMVSIAFSRQNQPNRGPAVGTTWDVISAHLLGLLTTLFSIIKLMIEDLNQHTKSGLLLDLFKHVVHNFLWEILQRREFPAWKFGVYHAPYVYF